MKQLNGPRFVEPNPELNLQFVQKSCVFQGSDAFHAQNRYDAGETIYIRAPGHVDNGHIHREIQGSAQLRAPEQLSLIRSMRQSKVVAAAGLVRAL